MFDTSIVRPGPADETRAGESVRICEVCGEQPCVLHLRVRAPDKLCGLHVAACMRAGIVWAAYTDVSYEFTTDRRHHMQPSPWLYTLVV